MCCAAAAFAGSQPLSPTSILLRRRLRQNRSSTYPFLSSRSQAPSSGDQFVRALLGRGSQMLPRWRMQRFLAGQSFFFLLLIARLLRVGNCAPFYPNNCFVQHLSGQRSGISLPGGNNQNPHLCAKQRAKMGNPLHFAATQLNAHFAGKSVVANTRTCALFGSVRVCTVLVEFRTKR
jgi:hypothetical protein